MQYLIISILTAAFWFTLRAYMISEEKNSKEQKDLNDLQKKQF